MSIKLIFTLKYLHISRLIKFTVEEFVYRVGEQGKLCKRSVEFDEV